MFHHFSLWGHQGTSTTKWALSVSYGCNVERFVPSTLYSRGALGRTLPWSEEWMKTGRRSLGRNEDRELWLPEAFPTRHFNSLPFRGLRHQSSRGALGFSCQNFPPRHPSRPSTQPSDGLVGTPSWFMAANACWRLPKPLARASTPGGLSPCREINSLLGRRENENS